MNENNSSEVISQRLAKLNEQLIETTNRKNEIESQIQKLTHYLPQDPTLLMFYGNTCNMTKRAEPFINQLESSIGKKLTRLEVYDNSQNQELYKVKQGYNYCGGVPYFYNDTTGTHISSLLLI